MKDPFARKDALRLKPLDVEGWPAPIDLRDGALTLGRKAESDVVLPGASFPSVSGRHARVEERGSELWVVDLRSRNGTLVNGERVKERRLVAGDVLRLGTAGPQFMVSGRRALEDTVFVDPRAVGLGVEAPESGAAVRRPHALWLTAVGASLAVAAAFLLRPSDEHQDVSRAPEHMALGVELEEAGLAFETQLADAWKQIGELEARERDLAQRDAARELKLSTWEERLRGQQDTLAHRLEAESEQERVLLARLEQLERETSSTQLVQELRAELARAREALDETRGELAEAQERFELLDPNHLAQTRLAGVAEVRRAVVLIESRLVLRHRESGALLHQEGEGFATRPNFEGRGEVWSVESTGSGFCVSPDGWIVTNRHVVAVPEDNEVLLATRGLPIDPVLELRAVFSGETQRHDLEVVRRSTDNVDLALARIEPFEGLPHLAHFDLGAVPPPPGSDIYLFGFPLGHYALQEGERVIASTFRGILSRNVGGQMQVDAGVHPGNSGGPITDASGRVVGVVFSVQALPDQTAVYTIGYGIPLADVARIWPPPVDRAPGEDGVE